MCSALCVLLPISVYTTVYLVHHSLMSPLSWFCSIAYLVVCIVAAQQIVVRSSGMVPYFSKSLMNTGTSPVAVAAVRCYVGAAFFILYDLIRGKIPKISLHSIPVFLVMGMAGIAGSFIFYAIAIQKLSTSMYNYQQNNVNKEVNLKEHEQILEAIRTGSKEKVRKYLLHHYDKHLSK